MSANEEPRLFKSSTEEVAELYHTEIADNKDLKRFEVKGFVHGIHKGKKRNVSLDTLKNALNKQHNDFQNTFTSFVLGRSTAEDLKQKIADIRNVAGLVFLKLSETKEEEAKDSE